MIYFQRLCLFGFVFSTLFVFKSFGQISRLYPQSLDVTTLDGTKGFAINGADSLNFLGALRGAAGLGDFNGDGIGDFIVGADGTDPDGRIDAGTCYLIYGRESFESSLELSDFDENNGFAINGIRNDGRLGAVSPAGDINGDGLADMIIGDRLSSGRTIFVVFGTTSEVGSEFDLNTLNGTNGFKIDSSPEEGLQIGRSFSGIGDVNGDGFDDLVIGLSGKDPGGAAYILFGKPSFDETYTINQLIQSRDGFLIEGTNENVALGFKVGGLSDINQDGFNDLIVSDQFKKLDADSGFGSRGEAYVILGQSTLPSSLTVSDLDGTNGFIMTGLEADSNIGQAIPGIGDFNGDGFDDFFISDDNKNLGNSIGCGYVIFGRSSFEAVFDLSLVNGTNGLFIEGIDRTFNDPVGIRAIGGADLNRDGFDDLLLSNRFGPEDIYVIYGGNTFSSGFSISQIGISNGFIISRAHFPQLTPTAIAEDFNGDRLKDLILCASGASPNGKRAAGQCYVLFGRNRTPLSTGLSDFQLKQGFQEFTFDVKNSFSDEEGDILSFTAESSSPDVVTVSIEGSTLTLQEVGPGISSIIVTAKDSFRGEISEAFGVVVVDIVLDILSDGFSELRVFPNPATSGAISVSLGQLINHGSLKITDINGRLVKKELIHSQTEIIIDIQDIPKGFYFLEISNDQRLKKSIRFAIK
ncbi:MAG: T9SS type A sorting domain-containing protein [Bacteroidota bacterium]